MEGTNMSLFHTIIPNWWAENGLSNTTGWFPGDGRLAERVWVADRCIQLNSQQIASMPIKWNGPDGVDEPAWISNPDPNWYPNGIGDAVHASVVQMYQWGFAILYVTETYANGFPRNWTVIPSESVHVDVKNGRRRYKVGAEFLDERRVVQIDRNPGVGITGTPALRAYAQIAWGLLAAGNHAMTVTQGGTPKFYIKSERKLQKDQAEALQAQWAAAASSRNGLPPIIPPELTPTEMSFNPSELALLDTQEFDAKMIAAAYGVPAMLLNLVLEGGLAYQNPAALGEMWWRFELRTTATRIANAWTAQMLPRGQWVTFDAADTFFPLDLMSEEDDPQLSQVVKASPTQQTPSLTAVGGNQ